MDQALGSAQKVKGQERRFRSSDWSKFEPCAPTIEVKEIGKFARRRRLAKKGGPGVLYSGGIG